jgi:addiction module RelE/StbE family toxin
MKIAWTSKSTRAFKRLIRKNPQLRPLVEKTLKQLAEDCFHPTLRTHKLTGDLADIWSCSIDYQFRVLFEFVKNPETKETAILLLNIGSHDEVY